MTLNTRAHIYTPTPPQPIFDHMLVWFDTSYRYSGPNQGGCSDLHAWLLTHLGEFLDGLPMPVEWKWMNEFTGEWHSVDEVSVLGDPVRGSLVRSSTLEVAS